MAEDFFSGVEQIKLKVGDYEMPVPTFYRSARFFVALLPAKLSRLRKMLPDKRFVPAQVFPGVGAIQLGAMEYFEAPWGPSLELVVVIPLNSPDFLQIPGYNMVRQLLRMNFHGYMYKVPVNDEPSVAGGTLSGWPNFVADLEFTETEEWLACEWKEEEELVLRLRGRKIPARRSALMKMFCHLYQNKQPQFNEGKFNLIEHAMNFNPSNAELTLGTNNELARELSGALYSTTPMLYWYSPNFQLILYGPEQPSLPFTKAIMGSDVQVYDET